MRYLSQDEILIRCDSFRRTQPLLATSGAMLYFFCAVSFPSGEETEQVGKLLNKSFLEDPFAFRVRVLLV